MPRSLSLTQARRFALNSQLLHGRHRVPPGKEGVARVIESLGYVQIDTISVVERAHHHTLWTRRPDYQPDMLHQLQAIDRRVFEYWGHALSILPMCDYRFYQRRTEIKGHPYEKWVRQVRAAYGRLTKPILERLRSDGPSGSRAFDEHPPKKRRKTWEPRAIRMAFELLFWQGDIMVTERRKFERVYDLTERVLPPDVDVNVPDELEIGRFLVRRALAAYGLAGAGEIVGHISAAVRDIILRVLQELVEVGDVVPVKVEGHNSMTYYALGDSLKKAAELRKRQPRLHLLSPFDNLIIQRDRIQRLFDFSYALECYVTASKRRFGYYAMPILWGERLVGRLDPKADRKQHSFHIRNLLLEPDFKADDHFLETLASVLGGLARRSDCHRVVVEKTNPLALKKTLSAQLRKLA